MRIEKMIEDIRHQMIIDYFHNAKLPKVKAIRKIVDVCDRSYYEVISGIFKHKVYTVIFENGEIISIRKKR